MLKFNVNNMDLFYQVTDFARDSYHNAVDFKCSRTLFSLCVSRGSPRCIIELQLKPRFFKHYACDDFIFQRTNSLNQFFNTFLQMKSSGFNSMTFTMSLAFHHLKLSFLGPLGSVPCEVSLPFLLTHQDFDVGAFDCGPFVSFDSFQFLWILVMLNGSHVTFMVTLTDSEAKLTGKDNGIDVDFILYKERGECIVEGVVEGEEIEFVIVLNPIESFYKLVLSNLNLPLQIYKSHDNFSGVISILIGRNVRYVAYSKIDSNDLEICTKMHG